MVDYLQITWEQTRIILRDVFIIDYNLGIYDLEISWEIQTILFILFVKLLRAVPQIDPKTIIYFKGALVPNA